MWLNSTLSVATRPFQPWATLPSALVDDIHQDYPAWKGLGRAPIKHRYTSDEEGVSTDTIISGKSLCKRHSGRGNRGNRSVSDSNETSTPRGRQKEKDGFSSKIQIPEFGGKKSHPHNVVMPLGNGPVVSRIIMNTMRIPTSCP